MQTITCPRCGEAFMTAATTSTRCPHCRGVVRVGRSSSRRERFDLGLLLACGHVGAVRDVSYRSEQAARDGAVWICGVCGATGQEVAAAAEQPVAAKAPDWLLAHLVESHPTYVWTRPLPVVRNPIEMRPPSE